MPDEYQERYLAHQKRKAQQLREAMAERHSNRIFRDAEIPEGVLASIVETARYAPSSCNRRGVTVKTITGRDDKAFLAGTMVGGVGWLHRAPAILLLSADPEAYKAPGELDYMPYLDAGFVADHLLLAATAYGLHSCFVNPNVRESNRAYVGDKFAEDGKPWVLCGAVALGYPQVAPTLQKELPPLWVLETS